MRILPILLLSLLLPNVTNNGAEVSIAEDVTVSVTGDLILNSGNIDISGNLNVSGQLIENGGTLSGTGNYNGNALHPPEPITINVPDDFATIQEAIDYSIDGDTILVSAGDYTETEQPVLFLNGKSILLKSTDGPENTFLPETQVSRGEEEGTKISGFTFQNLYRAINVSREIGLTSHLIIENCNFININQEAITCNDNSFLLAKNILINGARTGIKLQACDCNIDKTTIVNTWEAGIALSGYDIGNNYLTLTNSILWNEGSSFHYWNDPNELYQAYLELSYNNINNWEDNWNENYCNEVGNDCYFHDNISENPEFNNDYTLQPTSPCIDAGDPNSELDPDGTRADMGAYYYHQEAILGDINDDGLLNILDIITVVNIAVGSSPYDENADLNGDGQVNILDVIFLVNLVLNS